MTGKIKSLFIKPGEDGTNPASNNIKDINEVLPAFMSSGEQTPEPTKELVAGVVDADEIYKWSGVPNKPHNVYTVQAFISSLPATLDKEMKQNILAGILNAAQLDIAALVEDAEERLASLKNYAADINTSIQNEMDEDEEKIRRMLEEIEYARAKIVQAHERRKEQLKIIQREEVKIKEILTHL